MKRLRKVILCIGAGIFVLGLILCGIGWMTGGKAYVNATDLNKFDGSEKKNQVVLEKTQIDEVKDIHVDLSTIDFNIIESGDESYYISYDVQENHGKTPITYETKDGTFTLKEINRSSSSMHVHLDIGFLSDFLGGKKEDEKQSKVTLYVPKDSKFNDVTINMENGDFDVAALTCDTINLYTDLGDLTLVNFNTSKGKIQSSQGDIEIRDSDLNHINCSTDIGTIKIDDSTYSEGNLVIEEGDLITKKTSFQGENEISSDIGNIQLGGQNGVLDGCSIDANTGIGSIRYSDKLKGELKEIDDESVYHREVDGSENVLKIESSEGDITIGK